MNTKNWALSIVEAVIWYAFIYFWLYTIKNPVNLWLASLVLLVLAFIGTIACPWFRQTQAWRRLVGKGKREREQGERKRI